MTDQTVILQRRLAASIDRFFDAWTNAEYLAEWFGPASTHMEKVEVDAQTGGHYHIAMVAGEDRYVVFGEYKRVERPNLLEFTWQWETSSTEKGISLVTVELSSLGAETDLKLTHAKLASPESCELHTEGWISVLDRLVTYVNP